MVLISAPLHGAVATKHGTRHGRTPSKPTPRAEYTWGGISYVSCVGPPLDQQTHHPTTTVGRRRLEWHDLGTGRSVDRRVVFEQGFHDVYAPHGAGQRQRRIVRYHGRHDRRGQKGLYTEHKHRDPEVEEVKFLLDLRHIVRRMGRPRRQQ